MSLDMSHNLLPSFPHCPFAFIGRQQQHLTTQHFHSPPLKAGPFFAGFFQVNLDMTFNLPLTNGKACLIVEGTSKCQTHLLKQKMMEHHFGFIQTMQMIYSVVF